MGASWVHQQTKAMYIQKNRHSAKKQSAAEIMCSVLKFYSHILFAVNCNGFKQCSPKRFIKFGQWILFTDICDKFLHRLYSCMPFCNLFFKQFKFAFCFFIAVNKCFIPLLIFLLILCSLCILPDELSGSRSGTARLHSYDGIQPKI